MSTSLLLKSADRDTEGPEVALRVVADLARHPRARNSSRSPSSGQPRFRSRCRIARDAPWQNVGPAHCASQQALACGRHPVLTRSGHERIGQDDRVRLGGAGLVGTGLGRNFDLSLRSGSANQKSGRASRLQPNALLASASRILRKIHSPHASTPRIAGKSGQVQSDAQGLRPLGDRFRRVRVVSQSQLRTRSQWTRRSVTCSISQLRPGSWSGHRGALPVRRALGLFR